MENEDADWTKHSRKNTHKNSEHHCAAIASEASARSLLLVGFSSLLLFLFAIWQRPLARCLYTHIMNSFSPS